MGKCWPVTVSCEHCKRAWNPNAHSLDDVTAEVAWHLGYCMSCIGWWNDKVKNEIERAGKSLATIRRVMNALGEWLKNDSLEARQDGWHEPNMALQKFLDQDGWGPFEEHHEWRYWEDVLDPHRWDACFTED